jgi:hypothetical protein
MSVSCECCVLSSRGLCDELVPRPEESYRVWCVSNVCDHETSTKRGGPGPYRSVEPEEKKKKVVTNNEEHKESLLCYDRQGPAWLFFQWLDSPLGA